MRLGLAALLAGATACSVLNGIDERPRDGGGGGSGDDGGGGGGDSHADSSNKCDAAPLEAVLSPATVLLLVDASGSMAQVLDAGPPRYDGLIQALTGVGGPVDRVDHTTRFALSIFADILGGTCPNTSYVSSQLDARGNLAAALGARTPEGSTTGEDFQPILDLFLADPGGLPKTIYMFTDAPPRDCADAGADSTSIATGVLASAVAQGIPTRVVRIGTDNPSTNSFAQMASAGGAYPLATVLTLEDLSATINSTIEELAVCRFDLPDGTVLGDSATVTLDGTLLAYGIDWSIDGGTLVLTGACSTYRESPAGQVLVRPGC